jgi:ankyrin repeat protein
MKNVNGELKKATESNDINKVKELIMDGVNIDEIDEYEYTPLMIASESGYFEITKLLIENKADVNKKNFCGWTSLCYAATRNHFDIVELLIKSGANVNEYCQDGCSILMWVIRQQHNRIKMVKFLCERGADINAKSSNGLSVLKIAYNNNENYIADFLNSLIKIVVGSGESIDNAFANAEKQIPQNSTIIEKIVVSEPIEKTIDIKVSDNQTVEEKINLILGNKYILKKSVIKSEGKKGFLGIGKKLKKYTITYNIQGIVQIKYQDNSLMK